MTSKPREDWTPDFDYAPISLLRRRFIEKTFRGICIVVSGMSLVILVVLLGAIMYEGLPRLDLSFIRGMPSADPEKAGIFLALCGTIWVCATCAVMTMPVGVATAIFLEEYKPTNRYVAMVHSWLQLLISNLAGVPSIVYGLLGLTVFVYMFGILGSINEPSLEVGAKYYHQYLSLDGKRTLLIPAESEDEPRPELSDGMQGLTADGEKVEIRVLAPGEARPTDQNELRRTLKQNSKSSIMKDRAWYFIQLPLGYSVLAGALTLMLVVLPVVIISSQEALRAVPSSLREGGLGMGCTPWQVVWNITLPSATPGIMTGSILAMSRAMGEAAPILLVSSALYVSSVPSSLMSRYTIMPLQIYQWADDHNREFYSLAATGIIVLLMVLLTFNAVAVFVRQRAQKSLD